MYVKAFSLQLHKLVRNLFLSISKTGYVSNLAMILYNQQIFKMNIFCTFHTSAKERKTGERISHYTHMIKQT